MTFLCSGYHHKEEFQRTGGGGTLRGHHHRRRRRCHPQHQNSGQQDIPDNDRFTPRLAVRIKDRLPGTGRGRGLTEGLHVPLCRSDFGRIIDGGEFDCTA